MALMLGLFSFFAIWLLLRPRGRPHSKSIRPFFARKRESTKLPFYPLVNDTPKPEARIQGQGRGFEESEKVEPPDYPPGV